MRRGGRLGRFSNWFAIVCGLYLGLAYFALPAAWEFRERSRAAPEMVTRTRQGIAGDPINVGLVGNRSEVVHAFAAAGWDAADAVTLKTAIEIGESVLFDRPYPDAPVSPLVYEGHEQDLAFEQPIGDSADQRHHVRLWNTDRQGPDGRLLWLGAASFDRGVGLSHDTGAITHHISPDIDAERNFLMDDLAAAGMLASSYQIPGIGPTMDGRNGEGDRYFTDGKATIGVLRRAP
jgi:hypothetical protein